ncbi:hypothetical protein NQ317_006108 [Molorchus minor]|uniref:WD repeat-containing protein 75 second beta-propeller domain-containing protein n=1 Tax=Molorchus minor TaxID=1323400 RepID=A0ABQ9IZF7_9CUCU|nr:hypothetical protein NQ317_006108 [Molorchus minor]
MDIALNFKGGGSIISCRPLFSEDGESISVCWKNSLLQYNTKTGIIIHEYKGLKDKIVGFKYCNYDSYKCLIACSETGKVVVWKAITHYKILEKQLPVRNIETFNVIPSTKEDTLQAVISYKNCGDLLFAKVDVKERTLFKIDIILKNQKYFVDVSQNRDYVTVACNNKVWFARLNDIRQVPRHKMHGSRTFTCIACHPSEELVLTGDNTGRVLVWQNIFNRNRTWAVYHWHTLPVRTVCFSTAGSHFYSGGEECVLVKWNLDNIHDKIDNALRIFDSRLYQTTLIQHLVLGKQYDSGILYDPRTKALVMNGNEGQVQFYSPSNMSLLYNVDIVGQNKITNERDCTIQNTEIRKTAISKNGSWLATVEERPDQEYHSELRLKFWKFNSEKQTFELNTSVEYPHEKSVNSLLFQPTVGDDLHCVTVGDDKKFKIWQLSEITTVNKKDMAWKCYGVGFFRNLPCLGISFSGDGSLMAIGFDEILTVWMPDTCQLKCSLIHPYHKEKLRHIQFGNSNQCHLLVAAGENQLSVWNLLTLCMIWTVPVNVTQLVADPLSTYMAVLTRYKEVIIFSPISEEPIYLSSDLLKKDEVLSAAFIPSKNSNDTRLKWYERSHLYIITSNNELYCISGRESTTGRTRRFCVGDQISVWYDDPE